MNRCISFISDVCTRELEMKIRNKGIVKIVKVEIIVKRQKCQTY